MKMYVLGFAFCLGHKFCYMVQKDKPEWQAGNLNGIGGKIEDGETPTEAIIREFCEETSVEVRDWKQVATMGTHGQWVCTVFATTISIEQMLQLDKFIAAQKEFREYPGMGVVPYPDEQLAGEQIRLVNTTDLHGLDFPMIDNIPLLVEAAKYALDNRESMEYLHMYH